MACSDSRKASEVLQEFFISVFFYLEVYHFCDPEPDKHVQQVQHCTFNYNYLSCNIDKRMHGHIGGVSSYGPGSSWTNGKVGQYNSISITRSLNEAFDNFCQTYLGIKDGGNDLKVGKCA